MKKKQYKYIHILWHDELKFNLNIVRIIIKQENNFLPSEHLFVTPFVNVYNSIDKLINENSDEKKSKTEVEYYPTKNPQSVRILNYYANFGKWIFVHSLPAPHYSIWIKKKFCDKIIWRTWGHDTGYSYINNNRIKQFVKKFIEAVWKRKIKRFAAIGIANIVDEIEIREKFGNIKTFQIPYVDDGKRGLESVLKDIKKDGHIGVNVLVGHSGWATNKHITVMQELEKYKQENMIIYLILSYGEPNYIKVVKEYVKNNWDDNVIMIEKFMSYSEYIELLNKMDIAIFDYERSYALGNIQILINLRKKIFLNKKGVIKRAFDLEHVPYECTCDIKYMNYEKFTKPVDYQEYGAYSWDQINYSTYVEKWKTMLNELD